MDDVNLLPSTFLMQRQRWTHLKWWSLGLVVVLVVLPLAALALQRHLRAVENRILHLMRQREQLAARLGQLETLHRQQQHLHLRADIVNTLLHRTPLQALFFDITALTDDAIWLTQVRLHRAPHNASRQASPAPPDASRRGSFFTLGQRPQGGQAAAERSPETGFSLSLQGYATSTPRLADFMSGLSRIPYLSKVKLQVAQRGLFGAYEAIEFVIGIQL